jgi:hypothetical protein
MSLRFCIAVFALWATFLPTVFSFFLAGGFLIGLFGIFGILFSLIMIYDFSIVNTLLAFIVWECKDKTFLISQKGTSPSSKSSDPPDDEL